MADLKPGLINILKTSCYFGGFPLRYKSQNTVLPMSKKQEAKQ
jgi:hypothetical protein